MIRPNVVFVFADQWRAQATGYAGDPNVQTPHLDRLARESLNFTHAISGSPVCSPYRASLLTGQRPLTHGVFVNDVPLRPTGPSLAEVFADAGYETAWIGKWHVDGHGRSARIPRDRRLGFAYWKALECPHDYNRSAYYEGDAEDKSVWEGYDAIAQTRDAQAFIRSRGGRPFLLMLSWGPPHEPYDTAPPGFRELYNQDSIRLRPNVPAECAGEARRQLAGYYAHCTALDACVGDLRATLRECDLETNTLFVFTSDHGDMLGSQGEFKKQRPWDESIRVPFLLRFPGLPGWRAGVREAPIDAPDLMPTLLGLCGLPIPESVEGLNFAEYVRGGADPSGGAALLTCPHPFGQWSRRQHNGREYRGLRTARHTYVRDQNGPWLLYDNVTDPYQRENLVDRPDCAAIRSDLESQLQARLDATDDAFLPGSDYLRLRGYNVNENGTVPYTL